ncbi:isochorismatase [Liquorilactobacillus sucicola DSM 21376 = JCM 15457]|uniref:Isochorismatase hydrolase n=1 Tax=Liquorilactobacillus sucicola DSM 21376 = JCM 15457 TaxID=1423806 RepID=A0A023CV95_9LACO|nr:cysteine hydrolase family protein [Liquorilactobacillus sucicola]KRN05624.1 isochorismatase hydrolase [Liquorilactobacillus sucicola DSM 21376 = JCM 15457]GAJ25709.1 isochorismatase [Liquorilactobacillus sucicola DSM 21376 = JCM 15457]
MLGEALVVIDLQNGVCHKNNEDIYNFANIIAKVAARIKRYAAQGKPVVIVQHEDEDLVKGSIAWQLVPELELPDKVYFTNKKHANGFFHTNLNDLLIKLKISQLELCGAQTEYCVDATTKFAHGLGYKLLMSHGLTTTWDNQFMNAQQTIDFYENIWKTRFVSFID